MKLNTGTNAKPQLVNINAQLETNKGVRSGAIVEGVQRYFCMDIQRFKNDSTRANITQN
jgi:hypothetical protein